MTRYFVVALLRSTEHLDEMVTSALTRPWTLFVPQMKRVTPTTTMRGSMVTSLVRKLLQQSFVSVTLPEGSRATLTSVTIQPSMGNAGSGERA